MAAGNTILPPDKRGAEDALNETELEAALQLLVERAQYITGATGTALALPRDGEMICRASTGSSAPAVGARLQVRSGLTGESIASRRLLRCDNAESDPRVNLQACRALGIASIVVLPLHRPTGELRGLFELFSDHPYAFEERDLLALERMAALTLTALDLGEQRHGAVTPHVPANLEPMSAQSASPIAGMTEKIAAIPPSAEIPQGSREIGVREIGSREIAALPIPSAAGAVESVAGDVRAELFPSPPDRPPVESLAASASEASSVPETVASASLPQAVDHIHLHQCRACGFPVSEGRTLCVDCEEKQDQNTDQSPPVGQPARAEAIEADGHVPDDDDALPAFLANAAPVKESWVANHIPLLATVAFVLAVLIAFVLFR